MYYSLPANFPVTVEYSRGVLAKQGAVAIENPDLEIEFEGQFGPNYGLDVQVYPFEGTFFISTGIGRRYLSLDGGLRSNLILTSSAGSIATNSEIDLRASAWVRQSIIRVSVGWEWKIFDGLGYLSFILVGYTHPMSGNSGLSMAADLVNPKATIDVENEILEEAERKFESDLEEQTRDDVEPVENLGTPFIGFVLSFNFM